MEEFTNCEPRDSNSSEHVCLLRESDCFQHALQEESTRVDGVWTDKVQNTESRHCCGNVPFFR
jgi:hypothetical protein